MHAIVSTKGQIVIPVELRRKYGIKKGTRVDLRVEDGRIVLDPLTDEQFEETLDRLAGSMKGTGALEALIEDRKWEREREDAKLERMGVRQLGDDGIPTG